MRLDVRDSDDETIRLWADALAPVKIRSLDRRATPEVQLKLASGKPILTLSVRNAYCTVTDKPITKSRLVVSCVRLSYFPGAELARKWLAAAWAGYVQHEALEMVTMEGAGRPLDPHQEPYESCPWNRGLRNGLPAELTPEAMIDALAVVMDYDDARELVGAG